MFRIRYYTNKIIILYKKLQKCSVASASFIEIKSVVNDPISTIKTWVPTGNLSGRA
jgi:hypothetical protein